MLIIKKPILSLLGSVKYNINLKDKFLIIQNPKDYTKLVFDTEDGQYTLRQLTRATSFITILNTVLSTMQNTSPRWTMVSFNMCMVLGYFSVFALNSLSQRVINRMYIHNNLRFIDIQFFSAFWAPKIKTFHISQFQQPTPSYGGFTKFQVTSLGNVWINTQKNEYKSIQDYDDILDNIFRGIDLAPHLSKRSKPQL